MRHYLLFVSLGYFLLFISCKKYEPAPAAFFISTPSITVVPTATQGTASHKITDLWLYVDGKFQGAYPAGNTMPIVNYGQNVKVDLFSGIKLSGISDRSITSLIYEKISFDTLIESGKTISYPVKFKYNPTLKFIWMENFDSPNGFSLVKMQGPKYSDATFTLAAAPDCFEGNSGLLSLTDPNTFCRVESSVSYTLPAGNPNVFLELNYKANADFEVGVTEGTQLKGAITVRAKDSWNKIYIQLTEAISVAPTASTHKVYFQLFKPNADTDARVWLDNIKLIYL